MHEFLELWTSSAVWVSLITLTVLEIILGIDNIVFITILAGRLPKAEQVRARRLGLSVAMFSRIALLASLSWLTHFSAPLLTIAGKGFSLRDLILLAGGLFLIAKATLEIYHKVEHPDDEHPATEGSTSKRRGLVRVLLQIILIDIVFSLDSVITAIGTVDHLSVMVIAVLISVGVMMAFARSIGDFIQENPSVKILALSFLVMIGVLLLAEGGGEHLNKGYVYFGMAFSLSVEMLRVRFERNRMRKS